MSQPPLKPLEIEDLLNQYRSDLRKLEYQIYKTQTVIQELEKQAAEAQEALSLEQSKALPEAEETKAAAPVKRKAKTSGGRRGRPRKAKPADSDKAETAETAEAAEAAEAKEAAPEKTTAKRGRKPGSGKKKRGPGRPKKKSAKKGTAGKKGRQPSLSDWDEFVINSLKIKQQALITNDFVEIAKENPDIKSGEAQIKVKLNRSLHKLANRQNVLEKVEYSGRGFAYALKEWVNNKGLLPKKYAR